MNWYRESQRLRRFSEGACSDHPMAEVDVMCGCSITVCRGSERRRSDCHSQQVVCIGVRRACTSIIEFAVQELDNRQSSRR